MKQDEREVMKEFSTQDSIRVKALAFSFLSYLLPIIGPHATLLWGSILWQEVVKGRGGREGPWIIADFSLALSLQVVLFALLIWILRGQTWRRWITILPTVSILIGVLNWLYLLVIPTHFLIDPDAATEPIEAEVACSVPDAAIAPVRVGVQLELAQEAEAWILRLPELRYGILSMPGCKVRDLDLIAPDGTGGLDHVAPGGSALYRTWNQQVSEPEFWLLSAAGGDPARLPPPANQRLQNWQPVLSRDGKSIAWRVDGTPDEREQPAGAIRIRSLASGSEKTVPVDKPRARNLRLIAFDAAAGELVVSNDSKEILGIDLEGELRWGPVRVEAVGYLSADNFRRLGGGWLAWDLAGEDGPLLVSWSLILGEGIHRILKGRSITSVGLDPWSRYVAISVSPRYSFGKVRSAVYVIRTSDGQEVYRRYLNPHARSQIAFLGPHFLALTRYEEIEGKATQRIEVMRVPGPTPIAQVRRWIEAYRQVVLPLLPMYEIFDAGGIGEEDCAPLHQALSAAQQMPPLRDQVTTSTFDALHERLEEAIYECDRWDPGPFSDAFAEIELLITGIEDSLIYEHGLQALPEVESFRFDGYSIRPFEGPGGEVRAKRYR